MKCPTCGNDYKVDANFCTRCGSSLSAPTSGEAQLQNALAHMYRGVAYSILGQNKRAIQDYDEAIRLDPQQHVGAYLYRGAAYANLGKRVESERDIQKAKELGYSP